ncbi:MAG: hypothetical protein ACFB6R_15850 [Alphaproteobacteria bacterium]
MRRSQRRAHVILWAIILPLTAAGIVLALQARRPMPIVPESEGFARPDRPR